MPGLAASTPACFTFACAGEQVAVAEVGASETIMNTALIRRYEMQVRIRLPKQK